MKKLFFIIASVCLIIVSLSIAYYFTIALPRQNQQTIKLIKSTDDDVQSLQYDIDYLKRNLDDVQSNVSDIHDAMNL